MSEEKTESSSKKSADENTANWGPQAIQHLLTESIREQRLKRRWGIFFKLLFILVVGLFILLIFSFGSASSVGKTKQPHSALINISGPIFSNAPTNADSIATSLRAAFSDKNTQGIILRINSPGGSPVQADYVFNEILRLRAEHPKIKVYAVCTDICASGAYYIAAAANEIYANPASLVGSIGVIYNGFGFVDTLQKVGIQRRLLTAGQHKGFLDPFSPLKASEKVFAQNMLNDIHRQFINSVKKGRGKRLIITAETFSGLVWPGNQAKKMGLIDGFASASMVARNIIKNDNIVDYTVKPNYLERIVEHFGSAMGSELTKLLGLSSARQLQ